jgi:type IV secretory pathway TrbD component
MRGKALSVSSVPRVCSACGSASAWDAKFCQQCGRRLDEEAPRYYGALSPGPTFVLGCVFLLAAVIALLVGSWIAAIVLLALSIVGFGFFYDAARRAPEDPVARRVFGSLTHMRGWAAFARRSAVAWARALRDVVRLRRESRSLRREREPTLRSLGDAAYREDEPAATELRERLRQIDDELARRATEQAHALEAARRNVDEEHDAARATQSFSVDDITSGGKAEKKK